jgi:hypothetical protein
MTDPLSKGSSVGVKAGGDDDALHLVYAPDDSLTLCDQIAPHRNLQVLDSDIVIDDPHALCWSCLDEAKLWLKTRADA